MALFAKELVLAGYENRYPVDELIAERCSLYFFSPDTGFPETVYHWDEDQYYWRGSLGLARKST
jgi:hypothetical protein